MKSGVPLAVIWKVRLSRGDQGPWEGVQRPVCLCLQTDSPKVRAPHRAFRVLSLFIEGAPFPERTPLLKLPVTYNC